MNNIKFFFIIIIMICFSISSYSKENLKKDNLKMSRKEIEKKSKEISSMMDKAHKIINKQITDKETIEEVVQYFEDKKTIDFLKKQGVYHAIERIIRFIKQEYLTMDKKEGGK